VGDMRRRLNRLEQAYENVPTTLQLQSLSPLPWKRWRSELET